MADLWGNSGFELNQDWQFEELGTGAPNPAIADYSTAKAHDGVRSGKIGARVGFGQPRIGTVYQARSAIVGASYAVTGWTHSDDASRSGGSVILLAYYLDPNLPPFPQRVIYSTQPATVGDAWTLRDFGDIVAKAATWEVGFQIGYSAPGGPGELGTFLWYLDDWQATTLSEVMAKSTLTSFLSKLATSLAEIDPNIGKMFSTDRRKFSHGELEAASALRIDAAGAFDDVTRIGKKVTRFWIAETQIDTRTLTNCSAEYTHRVRVTGFYSFEQPDEDSQRTALELATIEILDKLNTKTVEQVDLSTGNGYHGFLNARPRMLNPVQPAALDNGLQGHMVELEVTFAEEVALA